MAEFALDPRLDGETLPVGELDLSSVRMRNERRMPWAILVPRRAGLAELHEMTRAERSLLVEEIALVSEAMARVCGAAKMNVAALGNQVRQLHVHVIARRAGDAAWPDAPFALGAAAPYPPGEAEALAAKLAKALNLGPSANTL